MSMSEKIQNELGGMPVSDLSANTADLEKRVVTLETLVHSLWLILQKELNYTNENLDVVIADALELESYKKSALKGMVCPSCGKKAQFSGSFKIKCIYCGTEAILNPYEAADYARKMDEQNAQEMAQMAQKEKWDQAVANDPYQSYDVTKDLNFDDFDDSSFM